METTQPVHVRVEQDLPHLGLEQGDLVRIGPDGRRMVSRYIELDLGDLMHGLTTGALSHVSSTPLADAAPAPLRLVR